MGSSKTAVSATLLLFFLFTTCCGAVSAQSPSTSDPNDQYGGYAKVTPSMAIIIVVLIAALFFMGFFSIYIRHCSESANSGSVRLTGGPLGLVRGSRRSAPRGLDGEVIGAFPTMQYSEVKGLKLGKGVLECAVCLNEFEDHETLRLIPKCDHVFHPECIDTWLLSHVTCPVCRANLTPQPVDDVIATEEPLPELDLEAARHDETGPEETDVADAREPEQAMNRERTRGGSSSWRWFPRSHTTGHSLVQPGENTDRFTLRLPEEVRKQIMSRQLERTMSLVVLPREGSSRRGFRVGGNNEGSSRGKNYNRLEKLSEPAARSDRLVFSRNPSFLTRASSFLTRASSTIIRSGSVRSPKVAANNGEGTSTRSAGPDPNGSNRPPV